MPTPNTAKSAELQVIVWFLQEGWELFTPVADLHGTDIVVRHPETRQLLSIQVKHKQPGTLNEGLLKNDWVGVDPPFDYLVFFVPRKLRGLVIPRAKLKKPGKIFIFFAKDKEGYSRGPVRPLYKDYAFDFASVPPETRSKTFVEFFSKVHAGHII
ncbi:MAG TPA: hypothetical protein VMV72_12160 [Verrucomicrobiae bacterium]|nr:hypothetical protein [Verrucomicrobiae bacterium]